MLNSPERFNNDEVPLEVYETIMDFLRSSIRNYHEILLEGKPYRHIHLGTYHGMERDTVFEIVRGLLISRFPTYIDHLEEIVAKLILRGEIIFDSHESNGDDHLTILTNIPNLS